MITLRAATAPAPTVVPRGPGPVTVVGVPHRAVGPAQVTTGRHAAWLRLWTTVLGLAFLTGRTLPAPPPQVRAIAECQPRRTGRLVGSLAEQLAAERGAALRGCYPPAALARALTGAGRRMLAPRPVPARAGQVWVIPQLRWAHEATRAGWAQGRAGGAEGRAGWAEGRAGRAQDGAGQGQDGVRPDDLAPPLDFALAGLPDWPGILAGQRLEMLLRHPAALTAPANRALAATALFGADGKAAFGGMLAADLALALPAAFAAGLGSTDRAPDTIACDRARIGVRGSAGCPPESLRGSGGCPPESHCGGSPPRASTASVLAEAMRLMDCRADWLIAYLR